jgi:hypothetical protein
MLGSSQQRLGRSWPRHQADNISNISNERDSFAAGQSANPPECADMQATPDFGYSNFALDSSIIQDMDMVSLRKELSRCHKALVTLQSRTRMSYSTQGHTVDLENEVELLRARLANAEESINSKDKMIVELAQAANDMSKCSHKQLHLLASAHYKNSAKIRDTVDAMSQQIFDLERVCEELRLALVFALSGQDEFHRHESQASKSQILASQGILKEMQLELRILRDSRRSDSF